jgi:DnaJ-class molecular chaperone
MRDPYDILGVAKSATAGEIKKAYRQLAKKFHPDHNKTDPKAKERFAEINSAYEIVGDEAKKAKFDRGEIGADGKPRGFEGFGAGAGPGGFTRGFGGGPGAGAHRFEYGFGGAEGAGRAGFDPADLFGEIFGAGRRAKGGAGAKRGEDMVATATVPLETVVHGGATRVVLPNGRTLEVKVPAGVEEGKQIRLRGQGHPAPGLGGEAGDALVTVKIAPHALFRIEGRDLRLDLPVALYEAALGAKIAAPTLDGKVELTIPPGSNGGRVLRLRGKGMPATEGKAAGDLYISLKLMLPDAPDTEFEAAMRKWREAKPYDPRAKL